MKCLPVESPNTTTNLNINFLTFVQNISVHLDQSKFFNLPIIVDQTSTIFDLSKFYWMQEPKTPTPKIKGIKPFESPYVKDANYIMKLTKSKEEEQKDRIKDILIRLFWFTVYILVINISQIR